MTRIAVITAVAAERDAVARGVGIDARHAAGPYEAITGTVRAEAAFVVVAGGVGPAAAAATAMAIALGGVDVLISAGIAGGYDGHAAVGEIVVATEIIAADLGADSPDGFRDLAALGFGVTAYAVDADASAHTAERLNSGGIAARRGVVVTVSTATGTDARAQEISQRHDAAAEAMEGAGVAHVATLMAIPMVELRAISNRVGGRDTGSWDLPAALSALERAMRVLFAAQ